MSKEAIPKLRLFIKAEIPHEDGRTVVDHILTDDGLNTDEVGEDLLGIYLNPSTRATVTAYIIEKATRAEMGPQNSRQSTSKPNTQPEVPTIFH